MNAWRAILAALVIFAAGVITGGLTVHLRVTDNPPTSPSPSFPLGPMRQRGELLDRMQRRLYLTPPQREHIELILKESHDRMRQLWDTISPQAQLEHKKVHELIRAELNPQQQSQFEELFKGKVTSRGGDDRRRRDDHHDTKVPKKPEATSSSNAPAQNPARSNRDASAQ